MKNLHLIGLNVWTGKNNAKGTKWFQDGIELNTTRHLKCPLNKGKAKKKKSKALKGGNSSIVTSAFVYNTLFHSI